MTRFYPFATLLFLSFFQHWNRQWMQTRMLSADGKYIALPPFSSLCPLAILLSSTKAKGAVFHDVFQDIVRYEFYIMSAQNRPRIWSVTTLRSYLPTGRDALASAAGTSWWSKIAGHENRARTRHGISILKIIRGTKIDVPGPKTTRR